MKNFFYLIKFYFMLIKKLREIYFDRLIIFEDEKIKKIKFLKKEE